MFFLRRAPARRARLHKRKFILIAVRDLPDCNHAKRWKIGRRALPHQAPYSVALRLVLMLEHDASGPIGRASGS
jgi:hypothetical protein